MAAPSGDTLRLAHLLLLYAGTASSIAGAVLMGGSDDSYWMYTLLFPGVLAAVAAQVCSGMLIFRSWKCVESHPGRNRDDTRTLDPGAAVALTFIPIANAVGLFFSFGWLPGQLNQLAQRTGLRARVDGNLGYFGAVMFACSAIPSIGFLFGVVAWLGVFPRLVFTCSKLAEAIESAFEAVQPRPEMPPTTEA